MLQADKNAGLAREAGLLEGKCQLKAALSSALESKAEVEAALQTALQDQQRLQQEVCQHQSWDASVKGFADIISASTTKERFSIVSRVCMPVEARNSLVSVALKT